MLTSNHPALAPPATEGTRAGWTKSPPGGKRPNKRCLATWQTAPSTRGGRPGLQYGKHLRRVHLFRIERGRSEDAW